MEKDHFLSLTKTYPWIWIQTEVLDICILSYGLERRAAYSVIHAHGHSSKYSKLKYIKLKHTRLQPTGQEKQLIPFIQDPPFCVQSTVPSFGLPHTGKTLTGWNKTSRSPLRCLGPGAHDVQAEAEGAGCVQPSGEVAQGRSICCLLLYKRWV